MEEKAAPESMAAERELLSTLLYYPEMIESAKGRVDPDDFFFSENKAIFEVITNQNTVDELIIYESLKHRKNIIGNELASLSYILGLTDGLPKSFKCIDSSVDIIKKNKIRREILENAELMRNSCYQDWKEFRLQIEDSFHKIEKIKEDSRYLSGEKLSDPIKKANEYFRQRFVLFESKKDRIAIPGWNIFNAKLGGGFKHGRNYTIASRPGSGKTSFIVHLATAFAKQSKKGIMLQIENPEFDIWDKIVSNICQIDSLAISNHADSFGQDDHTRIKDAIRDLSPYIFIEHRNIMTADDICRRLYEYKKQFGIEWFMVDYLQRIHGEKRKSELENITYHVQVLDEMAEKLDLVMILISMANRDSEGGKIGMKNMKGSGEIEQAADVLIAMQNSDEMADQRLELIQVDFIKNRHGRRGSIPMHFMKPYSYLTENLNEFDAAIENG